MSGETQVLWVPMGPYWKYGDLTAATLEGIFNKMVGSSEYEVVIGNVTVIMRTALDALLKLYSRFPYLPIFKAADGHPSFVGESILVSEIEGEISQCEVVHAHNGSDGGVYITIQASGTTLDYGPIPFVIVEDRVYCAEVVFASEDGDLAVIRV